MILANFATEDTEFFLNTLKIIIHQMIENYSETTSLADNANQDRSVHMSENRRKIYLFLKIIFFSDGDPLFQFPVRHRVYCLFFLTFTDPRVCNNL